MAKPLVVEIVADATKYAKGLKDAESQTGKFSKAAGVAGAAIMGGLVVGMKKSVDAAMDSQRVQAATESQLKTLGISYKGHAKQIDSVVQSTSKLAAVDDEDLQGSFNRLLPATHNVGQALKDMQIAADVARARNISLETATNLVAKANLGGATALKKLGIQMTPVTSAVDKLKATHDKYTAAQLAAAKETDRNAQAQANLAKLQKTFGGAAEAYGKTAAGAQERLGVAIENLEESMGKLLLPMVSKVAGAMADLAGYFEKHQTLAKVLTIAIGALGGALVAVTGIMKVVRTAQLALNFAMSMNPIGIVVIALGALVAALVIAYQKSETFRNIVNAAFDAVKTAINALKNAFQTVLNFMASNWKTIAVLISGPFAPLVALATNAFGIRSALVGAFNAILTFVRDKVGEIAGAFAQLPGKIGGAISGAMHFLWDTLQSIFNPKVWAKKILGFLGFGSPSPFFVDIGKQIITSIAHGVGQFAGIVEDSVKKIAGDVLGSIGGTQGGGVSGKGGVGVEKSGGGTLSTLLGWAAQEGIRVTSTNTGNHVKGSYHYQNRAIDVAGSAGQMAKFFMDTVSRFGVARITELFYDPMGWYVDNGRAVKGRIGGHSDHVHFALAQGGIVRSPTMALIGEAGPEAVIPLSRNTGGGAISVNIEHADMLSPAAVQILTAEVMRRLSYG